MFRVPICRAHCAVIFAIAQLSCVSRDIHVRRVNDGRPIVRTQ